MGVGGARRACVPRRPRARTRTRACAAPESRRAHTRACRACVPLSLAVPCPLCEDNAVMGVLLYHEGEQ